MKVTLKVCIMQCSSIGSCTSWFIDCAIELCHLLQCTIHGSKANRRTRIPVFIKYQESNLKKPCLQSIMLLHTYNLTLFLRFLCCTINLYHLLLFDMILVKYIHFYRRTKFYFMTRYSTTSITAESRQQQKKCSRLQRWRTSTLLSFECPRVMTRRLARED